MKGYFFKISQLSTFLLVGILFVGTASAQTRSLFVWSQQETEALTNRAAIAISPDGALVASGRSDSNDVNIRNAADGSLVRTLTGQNNNANVIKFSPDSQYLATGTGQGGQTLSLNLWRVSDGVRLVGRIGAFTNGTIGLSFSPDGQLLVASGFHSTGYKIYHVPYMSLLATVGNFDPDLGYNVRINTVAFSNDGQLIAIGDTNSLKLRRVSDGSLVRKININPPYAMPVLSVAFSPNGLTVAAGVNSIDSQYANCIDCSIKLFQISDGALLHTYNNGNNIVFSKIGFSPNGQIIAAGYAHDHDNSGAAQFWAVSTERTLRRDDYLLWVWDFAYFPLRNAYAFYRADGVVAVARAPLPTSLGDEKPE